VPRSIVVGNGNGNGNVMVGFEADYQLRDL
jgi:hypothetical protein